jgi:hypothetical protein
VFTENHVTSLSYSNVITDIFRVMVITKNKQGQGHQQRGARTGASASAYSLTFKEIKSIKDLQKQNLISYSHCGFTLKINEVF